MEELAVVVDPAHPLAGDELVAEDLAPERVDLIALGEESVAADIEPIAFVLVGPADPADECWLGLEDDAGGTVAGQLVGGGEAGGTGAGDDGGMGGDDGDLAGLLDPGPSVRGQAGSDAFRAGTWRIGAHPGPPWRG